MSTTLATVIHSAAFGDVFSTAPIRSVFSDANRVQKYLDFEAALARAQARLALRRRPRRKSSAIATPAKSILSG